MPVEIPGKSIRPADASKGTICPRCLRFVLVPKVVKNKKGTPLKYLCPFCGQDLNKKPGM